jgi:predicted ATPase/DNA-binding SARP family transcriptional activator
LGIYIRLMSAAAELEFRLLGPLEVHAGEQLVPLSGHKQRALLAILLMHANEVVAADRLIDALWGGRPPATAATALQVHMSELRKTLKRSGAADVIRTRSPGYVLSVEPERVDVLRFERLLAAARKELVDGDPERAVNTLDEALSLWQGVPLADFQYEPFAHAEAARLEELRLEAVEERIEAELALGRHAEVVGKLEALVSEHPLRERLRGHLMLALYRNGRQADALAVHREGRRLLRDELGLEPGPELRKLQAAILRQDPALIVEPPELRARRHLPAQPNSFIGRERELQELVDLIRSGGIRLVTLTGPGGVGKTRLALAAAERLAASFADGVWFVDLAPVSDAALVPSTIASALGAKERPEQPAMTTLVASLRGLALLLLVDNVEHVLEAAAHLSELLKEAPRLKLLATSRTALNLYGEHRFEVPALELPDVARATDVRTLEAYESSALFLARARAAKRHFTLDAQAARSAAEICIRLDGLPLAIELAAARLDHSSIDALHDGLGTALDFLAEGPRDADPRQQTLRQTIDWSYQLLTPTEQRLFSCLAVFAGGWTLEAARHVCNAAPEALDSLVQKHVISRSDVSVEPRYWMLETLREYAAEKLEQSGAAQEIRRRHAQYMAAFAATAGDEYERSDVGWHLRVEAEQNNLRAALAFVEKTEQTDLHLELVGNIWRYWYTGGLSREGRRWAAGALAKTEGERTARRAKVLAAASAFASAMGDLADAEAYAEDCLSTRRELGERHGIAEVLSGLGHVAYLRGDLAKAERLFEEAAALARESGSTFQLALAVGDLGNLVLLQGDVERATALTDQALTQFQELDSEWGRAWALNNRAFCLLQLDRERECLEAARESLELVPSSEAQLLYCNAVLIAAVATRRGEAEDAAQLIGVADTICQDTALAPGPLERELYHSTKEQLLGALGRERYEAASEAPAAMSIERATDYLLDACAEALEAAPPPADDARM